MYFDKMIFTKMSSNHHSIGSYKMYMMKLCSDDSVLNNCILMRSLKNVNCHIGYGMQLNVFSGKYTVQRTVGRISYSLAKRFHLNMIMHYIICIFRD